MGLIQRCMSRILVFFILFIFSQAKAQDTIVLKTGEKILAKHIHIGTKLHFRDYTINRGKRDSIDKDKVDYVIHKSGWRIPMIPPSWYSPIIIIPGIGMSGITMQFHNYFKDEGANIITLFTPVYNLSVDYGVNQLFSVGVTSAWQYLKINPSVSHTYTYYAAYALTQLPNGSLVYAGIDPRSITITAPNFNAVETLTRLNIGCRLLYHIRNDDVKDFYIGAGAGFSFWSDKSSPTGYSSLNGSVLPSIHAIIGERKDVNNFFGFEIEGGIGTPYFANAGIYFKMNTRKK